MVTTGAEVMQRGHEYRKAFSSQWTSSFMNADVFTFSFLLQWLRNEPRAIGGNAERRPVTAYFRAYCQAAFASWISLCSLYIALNQKREEKKRSGHACMFLV